MTYMCNENGVEQGLVLCNKCGGTSCILEGDRDYVLKTSANLCKFQPCGLYDPPILVDVADPAFVQLWTKLAGFRPDEDVEW